MLVDTHVIVDYTAAHYFIAYMYYQWRFQGEGRRAFYPPPIAVASLCLHCV